MVYVTSWDEFVERSVQLYKADPQSVCYLFFFLLFGSIAEKIIKYDSEFIAFFFIKIKPA